MINLIKIISAPLLFLLMQISTVKAGIIHLGSAENAVIASGHGVNLGSEAHIFGNVLGTQSLLLGSGVIIEGDACSNFVNGDSSAKVYGNRGACGGLDTLKNDITSASQQLSSFGDKSNSFSVTQTTQLNAGNYWLEQLVLDTGESLTITGDENSVVVINVTGMAKLGSGASIELLGGILAQNVFFNFVGDPLYSSFEIGGANISGTFISDSRYFSLGDGATLDDTRFITNGFINGNVQDVSFTTIPEPATMSLFLAAFLALCWFSYRRRLNR